MGVVSYSTDLFEKGDGLGQLYMLAFTNILADEHGVDMFNVKQKGVGEDWEEASRSAPPAPRAQALTRAGRSSSRPQTRRRS